METFTKDDLVYEYNWSKYEKDDPKISGMPDTSLLNLEVSGIPRFLGCQILPSLTEKKGGKHSILSII